jgi:hypothetical protein
VGTSGSYFALDDDIPDSRPIISILSHQSAEKNCTATVFPSKMNARSKINEQIQYIPSLMTRLGMIDTAFLLQNNKSQELVMLAAGCWWLRWLVVLLVVLSPTAGCCFLLFFFCCLSLAIFSVFHSKIPFGFMSVK